MNGGKESPLGNRVHNRISAWAGRGRKAHGGIAQDRRRVPSNRSCPWALRPHNKIVVTDKCLGVPVVHAVGCNGKGRWA